MTLKLKNLLTVTLTLLSLTLTSFPYAYATPFGPANGLDYTALESPPNDPIFLTKMRLVKSTGRVNVYDTELAMIPNPGPNDFRVRFLYFKARRRTPRPVLIIPPSLEGVTIAEKAAAFYLAFKGVSSLVFKPIFKITDYKRKLDEFDGTFKVALFSLKLMVDWASTRPEDFDQKRVGAFGLSLGGIMSSILIGQDSRVKAAYTVVAGGNLPHILAHSNHKFLRSYRWINIRKEKLKNVQGYEARLKELLSIDPLLPGIQRDSEDVFMYMAGRDTIVPTKDQKLLWQAFAKPRFAIVRRHDHFITILTMVFRMNHVLGFFHRRWRIQREREGANHIEQQDFEFSKNTRVIEYDTKDDHEVDRLLSLPPEANEADESLEIPSEMPNDADLETL